MADLETRAYWVERPGAGALRPEILADEPRAGTSLVRAEFSGVSPGTERLVGLGRVPAASRARMACRYMAGDFALPVKYGYTLVGVAVAGALEGRRLFVMHPHQGLARVEDAHCTPVPEAVPATRAVLIPNLETALNAVWDADLSPGQRCLVVGGGVVGLLTAYALARTHQSVLCVVETRDERRAFAQSLPWVRRAIAPAALDADSCEVAFHTSGTSEGLQAALDAVGFEGRVVDLSWYGDRSVTLDLGSGFHTGRKRIIASQVGAVAPARRDTHDAARRLAEVVALLEEPALDALVGAPIPFAAMPEMMTALYEGRAGPATPLIDHREEWRS
jgi:threonine dehydrogenase-like Zn-dependent dehydrogenase